MVIQAKDHVDQDQLWTGVDTTQIKLQASHQQPLTEICGGTEGSGYDVWPTPLESFVQKYTRRLRNEFRKKSGRPSTAHGRKLTLKVESELQTERARGRYQPRSSILGGGRVNSTVAAAREEGDIDERANVERAELKRRLRDRWS